MRALNDRFSYDETDCLGQGTYGTVYDGRDSNATPGADGIAIKLLNDVDSVDRFRQYAKDRFEIEIALLKKLTELYTSEVSAHVRYVADGTTSDGRRFLVMEQCSGIPIDQFLSQCTGNELAKRLDLTGRIVRPVLQTLANMHQDDLIHRDIKPDHILVHQNGKTGELTVRLIDFGMAKASNDSSQDLTATAGNIGSPGFQAPEAKNVSRWDPLTQFADVYSIAAVILVCMSGKSIGEISSTDRKSRWTRIPKRDFTAALSHVPENSVTVINRCLDQTPSRRMTSAELLRFFDEWMKADEKRKSSIRPRSLPYSRQLKSLKHENGFLLGSAIAVVTLLVCVLLGAFQYWRSSDHEKRKSQAILQLLDNFYQQKTTEVSGDDAITSDERQERRKRIEEEHKLNRQLFKVDSAAPAGLCTSTSELREFQNLLIQDEEAALRFAESTRPARLNEARRQPNKSRQLLEIDLHAVALLELKLRNLEASQLLVEILQITPEWKMALERSLNLALNSAYKQNSTKTPEEAIRVFESAIPHVEKLNDLSPNTILRRRQADFWSQWSLLLVQRGRKDDLQLAVDTEERCLSLRRRLKSAADAPPDIDRDIAISLERLGEHLRDRGTGDDAETVFSYYKECLEIRRFIYDHKQNSPQARRDLHVILCKLAFVKRLRDVDSDQEKALEMLIEGLQLAELNFSENPDSPEFRRDIAYVSGQLGDFYSQRRLDGDLRSALEYFERSLKSFRELQDRRPHVQRTHRDVAHALRRLGDFFFDRYDDGDAQKAESAYRESLKITSLLHNELSPLKVNSEAHAASLERLGDFLGDRGESGDLEESVRLLHQCILIHEDFVAKSDRSTEALQGLSAVLESYCFALSRTTDSNDLIKAIEGAQRELEISNELLLRNPNSWFCARNVSVSLERLGRILEKSGKKEDLARSRQHLTDGVKLLGEWRPVGRRTVEFEEAFAATAEPLAIQLARFGNAEDYRQSRELWTDIIESRTWIVGQEGEDRRFGEELAIAHYNAGCSFALIAANDELKTWTDLAIEELKAAVVAGFSRHDLLRTDPDLLILKDHPDFKELLSTLPE